MPQSLTSLGDHHPGGLRITDVTVTTEDGTQYSACRSGCHRSSTQPGSDHHDDDHDGPDTGGRRAGPAWGPGTKCAGFTGPGQSHGHESRVTVRRLMMSVARTCQSWRRRHNG